MIVQCTYIVVTAKLVLIIFFGNLPFWSYVQILRSPWCKIFDPQKRSWSDLTAKLLLLIIICKNLRIRCQNVKAEVWDKRALGVSSKKQKQNSIFDFFSNKFAWKGILKDLFSTWMSVWFQETPRKKGAIVAGLKILIRIWTEVNLRRPSFRQR